MPTFCFCPVSWCTRSLMNVSVIAVTSLIEPLSQMAVSMQWASRSPVTPLPAAAASSRHRAAPALRQIFGDRPVLQKVGPVVKDLAQLACVDDLLGQRHRRARGDSCTRPCSARRPSRRPAHISSPSARVHGQRLLAQDHLAGLGSRRSRSRGAGCWACRCRSASMSSRCDQLAPVGLDRLVAPLIGERLNLLRTAGTGGLEHRTVLQFGKKSPDPLVAVGVGPAHEAVADHADVEWFRHHVVAPVVSSRAA